MAALAVGRVGAVIEVASVGREAERLDLPGLRRQADRRRGGGRLADPEHVRAGDGPGVLQRAGQIADRYREEPRPFFGLELEDDVIAAPRDAVDPVEDAIVFRVVPELPRVPRLYVGDPERRVVSAGEERIRQPRTRRCLRSLRRALLRRAAPLSATTTAASAATPLVAGVERGAGRVAETADASLRLLRERRARTANEGNARAVGRPRRTRVAIDARRHVGDRARRQIVDGDVTVIGAVADEGNLPAVGRPHGIGV